MDRMRRTEEDRRQKAKDRRTEAERLALGASRYEAANAGLMGNTYPLVVKGQALIGLVHVG